jgi:hypothetical protein
VLVEFGPAPTVVGPLGAGMTPHGYAVVSGSVHQKLGQVKFLLSILHTDTFLSTNIRAVSAIRILFAGYFTDSRAFSIRSAKLGMLKGLVM